MRRCDSPVDNKPRILYLGVPKHSSAEIRSKYQHNFDIDILDVRSRKELMTALPDTVKARGPYQAVVCRLGPQPFEPFNHELLSPLLPELSVVVSAQSGYDDFDVDWMTSNGIWFANTRAATCKATADMTIFLMLAVLRNTSLAEKSFRQGLWRGSLPLGRDLDSMTVGIIGMGSIGSCVARKAVALGMTVQCFSRRASTAKQIEGVHACDSIEALLKTADVVSLHCPLSTSTFHLIDETRLRMMKDGSYLINTARGAVVDNDALIQALESGRLAGAGLDVFENEPNGINPYFMQSDKVVCQPHMGGLTEGAFERAEEECLANVRAWVENGRPVAPVNEVE